MSSLLDQSSFVIDGPIGTSLAEMSFGCPPAVTRALYDAIERTQVGYLSARDVESLGESTAAWLDREYSWKVDPHTIRPVADLVAGFRAILTHFVPVGEPIIVPTPGYMPFLSMPETIGRPVIEVPMHLGENEWEYDFNGIAAAFQAGGRLLVLCNPHNPIGKVATEPELAQLEQLVHDAEGLVFSDEVHAPITLRAKPHIVYAQRNSRAASHTVTATSASKAFNIPGVKCGQLIFSNPEHLNRWRAIGRWHEHQTSVLGVISTQAAYSEGRPWLTEVVEYTRGNIRAAVEILDGSKIRCTSPDATYLMWLDVRGTVLEGGPTGQSSADLARSSIQLIGTDGRECGAAGNGFIRFNGALPRPHVREAMYRLVSATDAPSREFSPSGVRQA